MWFDVFKGWFDNTNRLSPFSLWLVLQINIQKYDDTENDIKFFKYHPGYTLESTQGSISRGMNWLVFFFLNQVFYFSLKVDIDI